jgi:Tol biopolymer transport system component
MSGFAACARRPLVAVLALGLLAGCGGEDARDDAAQSGEPVAAPAQQAARIAAIRLQSGNPPHFALVTVADDGSNLRVLARAPADDIERISSQAWSPDAKQVYFVGVLAEREGDRFIYYESDAFAVAADGGEPRRITSSRDVQAAVPSPDGRTLLVARDEHPGRRPFTSSLWLYDANGKNERRLLDAKDGRLDRPGSWSPDGRAIGFTRCSFLLPAPDGFVSNSCAVYTVSPDGSRLRKLAERSSEPAFSPDGRTIAFVSDRDEHGKLRAGEDEDVFANELYVMTATGAEQRRLTRSATLAEAAPVWSADGSRIAFAREGPAAFQQQLMVVKADGSCPTLLVGDASNYDVGAPSFSTPVWRPGRVAGDLAPLACD